jgi:hypothetical protein
VPQAGQRVVKLMRRLLQATRTPSSVGDTEWNGIAKRWSPA